MNRKLRRRLGALTAVLILAAASWVVQTRPAEEVQAGATVVELFETRRSGVMVEAEGRVARVLPEDDQGSRHQRLVLDLDEGGTLLISHNIDLAPRIPRLATGQRVHVRGQYEWNSRGGLLHWTHHDPDGSHSEGWVETGGRRYE